MSEWQADSVARDARRVGLEIARHIAAVADAWPQAGRDPICRPHVQEVATAVDENTVVDVLERVEDALRRPGLAHGGRIVEDVAEPEHDACLRDMAAEHLEGRQQFALHALRCMVHQQRIRLESASDVGDDRRPGPADDAEADLPIAGRVLLGCNLDHGRQAHERETSRQGESRGDRRTADQDDLQLLGSAQQVAGDRQVAAQVAQSVGIVGIEHQPPKAPARPDVGGGVSTGSE